MQVVELLIQKLEDESSFHRKVNLFFLVDSITQCSHSQKGRGIFLESECHFFALTIMSLYQGLEVVNFLTCVIFQANNQY